MIFYIKCQVDFEPKKTKVSAPEDSTEQELRLRLLKKYPRCPVTHVFVAKTEEDPDEFFVT